MADRTRAAGGAWPESAIPRHPRDPGVGRIGAEDLKRLRDAGPALERAFLGYLVRQEELQVRMMHAALIKEYAAIPAMVSDFLAAEG